MKTLALVISCLLNTSLFAFDFSPFNAVVLLSVDKGFAKYYCSGVAIAPYKVITAAHCTDSAIGMEVIFDSGERESSYRVESIDWKVHPGYNKEHSYVENDLSLVYLNDSAPYSTYFIDIGEIEEGYSYIRFGYGMRESKNIKTVIEHLRLDRYDNRRYTVTYSDIFGVMGDSGGPVYKCLGHNRYELVSIHSTSFDGQKTAGPSLENFRTWLQN